MKAYGKSLDDAWTCEYGCCTGKADKKKNCRKTVDSAHRKTARQEGKEVIKDELITVDGE